MVTKAMSLNVRRSIICLALSFLFLSCSLFTIHCQKTTVPNNFYIELRGQLQNEKDSFFVQYSNGSSLTSMIMLLRFAMNRSHGDQYIACVSVTLGSSYYETIVDATIESGRLMVDSTPSIFLISPSLLIDGETIQLCQAQNRTLEGTVARTGIPLTAIGDYRITSKMVIVSHTDASGIMNMPLTLGYDLETGILNNAAGQLVDVLLSKLGIDFILGGTFDLASYSENLPFKLISQFPTIPVLIVVSIAIFIISVILIYKRLGGSNRQNRIKGAQQCL